MLDPLGYALLQRFFNSNNFLSLKFCSMILNHQCREVEVASDRGNVNKNDYRRRRIRMPDLDKDYLVPEENITIKRGSMVDIDIDAARLKTQNRAQGRCYICHEPIHLPKDYNRASVQRRMAPVWTASTMHRTKSKFGYES